MEGCGKNEACKSANHLLDIHFHCVIGHHRLLRKPLTRGRRRERESMLSWSPLVRRQRTEPTKGAQHVAKELGMLCPIPDGGLGGQKIDEAVLFHERITMMAFLPAGIDFAPCPAVKLGDKRFLFVAPPQAKEFIDKCNEATLWGPRRVPPHNRIRSS